MKADKPHLVEVRRLGRGFFRRNYHITLLSPDHVQIQDWQESYSLRDIEKVFNQLRQQYGQVSISFLDPLQDISSILHRLTGNLGEIAAWYRANAVHMTQQQQADIQASFQPLLALVSAEANTDSEQSLSAYYTAEATIIKSGLVRIQFQIKIIDGYIDVVHEFQGRYTFSGLYRVLYKRYPNLQGYCITWHLSDIDSVLDYWIKSPIQGFQADYVEHQNRFTPEQDNLLRAIIQRIWRLLNG